MDSGFRRNDEQNHTALQRPRTGAEACPCYGEQFDDRDSFPTEGFFNNPSLVGYMRRIT